MKHTVDAIKEYMSAFPQDGRGVVELLGKFSSVAVAEMQNTTDAIAAGARLARAESNSIQADLEQVRIYAADAVSNALLASVALVPGGVLAMPVVAKMAAKHGVASRSVKSAFSL